MNKKNLILTLCLAIFIVGSVWAQEPPRPGVIARIPLLSLKINLDCCHTDCNRTLNTVGLILVEKVSAEILNIGEGESGPVTAKIEFYDANRNLKTIDYNLPTFLPRVLRTIEYPIPSLILKEKGVKVIVTYADAGGHVHTKSLTYNRCGSSDWSEKPFPKR